MHRETTHHNRRPKLQRHNSACDSHYISANETKTNQVILHTNNNMPISANSSDSEISNMWIRDSTPTHLGTTRTEFGISDEPQTTTTDSQRSPMMESPIFTESQRTAGVWRWSRRKSDFCVLLVAFAALLSVCHAAPRPLHHHHKRRHLSTPDHNEMLIPKWRSPCYAGSEMPLRSYFTNTNVSSLHSRPTRNPCADKREKIEPLLKAVNVVIFNTEHQQAINTSYISEWFRKRNGSYKFLKTFGPNDSKVRLRKWHNLTQIYVGAFQSLYKMQHDYDKEHNTYDPENNTYNPNVTADLIQFTTISSNFLCEIESRMQLVRPKYIDPVKMNKTVTFWKEPNELSVHLQFAKVRFIEFLKGMQHILATKLETLKKRPQCSEKRVSQARKELHLRKKKEFSRAGKKQRIPILTGTRVGRQNDRRSHKLRHNTKVRQNSLTLA